MHCLVTVVKTMAIKRTVSVSNRRTRVADRRDSLHSKDIAVERLSCFFYFISNNRPPKLCRKKTQSKITKLGVTVRRFFFSGSFNLMIREFPCNSMRAAEQHRSRLSGN
jgi:hypothetical protein